MIKDEKTMNKNKSSSLKKAAAIAAIVAVPAIASGQTKDAEQVKEEVPEFFKSSIEWHFADNDDKARLNLFYNLPLKTDVYSFMEFYGKKGYFGKSMLYTPLFRKWGVGVKTETKHALLLNEGLDDIYFNTIGFGFEKRGIIPGNIFAAIKFLPYVFGKDGREESAILGYVVSKDVKVNDKLNINISSFLDFDIANKMKSDYGESGFTAEIKTKRGQFDVGVGYNHNVSGKLAPNNQFRARLGYHPKK